jgi:hypothetical protein
MEERSTYAKNKLVGVGAVDLDPPYPVDAAVIRGRKVDHSSVDYVYGKLRSV